MNNTPASKKPRGRTAKGAPGKSAPRTASKPAAERPRSLTAQAYERIEELIVKLELHPGTAISEAELSARLGIGRTPVREALQRLAREHLVQILPQRGVLVSELDIKRQLRLLEARREVERMVARCAARRASDAERKQFAELAREFIAAAKAKDQTRFMPMRAPHPHLHGERTLGRGRQHGQHGPGRAHAQQLRQPGRLGIGHRFGSPASAAFGAPRRRTACRPGPVGRARSAWGSVKAAHPA